MRVVGVCGSPRREGNTAFLLRTALAEVSRRGHEVDYLHLADLRLSDCNGCLVCEQTGCTGDCTIADDMQTTIVPQLLASDALVLGSPSYFDLPTAQMKRFMDRSNMILSKLTERRLVYGLVVVGQSDPLSLEATCRALRRYCEICGMTEAAGSPVLAIGRDESDVRTDSSAISAAKVLAELLVTPGGTP